MKVINVAVKAIIVNGSGEYLIIRKSDMEDINPNTFDLPGGRINFGEKLEVALKREVKEETGLNIEIVRVSHAWTFTIDDSLQIIGIDFICRPTSGVLKISNEHTYMKWMQLSEIEEREDIPDTLRESIRNAEELKAAVLWG